MSGSGREALPDVREWSGGPPGCPGVVWRPTQMSECSGGPPGCPEVVRRTPGCPGVVGRPSRMFGSGRETLPDVQKVLPLI